MAKKHYLIAGLPRSRTAWLANLLTWGDSFCFHEALFDCASMDEFKKLMSSPILMRYVGDADPNIGFVAQSILEAFPAIRIVFIHRDIEECIESEFNAMCWERIPGSDTITKKDLEERMRIASQGLSHLWKSLAPDRKLMVPYPHLDRQETVRDVWDFCLPNTPWNDERYMLLRDLRVTQCMKNRYDRNPSCPFQKLIEEKLCQVQDRTT